MSDQAEGSLFSFCKHLRFEMMLMTVATIIHFNLTSFTHLSKLQF